MADNAAAFFVDAVPLKVAYSRSGCAPDRTGSAQQTPPLPVSVLPYFRIAQRPLGAVLTFSN